MSRSVLTAVRLRTGFFVLAVASQVALSQQSEANRVASIGSLDGIVTDTNLIPLANATVSVVGAKTQVVTGSNGRFRILDLVAGSHYLLIRRVGFEPSSSVITVAAGDTLRASFALQPSRTDLDTVRVRGNQLSPKMLEFEQRRKLGEGRFMTEGEIDSLNLVATEDLFRHLISDHVRPAFHSNPMLMCERAQWFLDGVLLPPPPYYKELDLPSPKELAGIEYYSSPANTPLRFKSSSGGGFCGVILMWTKDGSRRP
jgi:hypothetical protein